MALGVVFLTPDEPVLGVLLRSRSALLGRSAKADVRLPEPTVSARHVSLKKRGSVYLISDEGGKNGTLVQSRDARLPVKLAPESPRVVLPGDRIFLGNVALELYPDAPEAIDGGVEWIEDPKEVPIRLVRRALERLGAPVAEDAVRAAVSELLRSPEEAVMAEAPDDAHAGDSKYILPSDEVLPPSPLPVDLALSVMALSVSALAGIALYRLVSSGALVTP